MATRGQSVARSIRDWVLDGTYGPGARLNEIEAARRLGVSRTPVRGALAVLAAEGLLEYLPNSGYVVRQYSAKEIEGVYEVRSVLEGLAARTVAERGLPDDQRGVIHRALSETAALCDAGEWTDDVQEAWVRLNEGFHEAIFASAGNQHLRELIAKSRSIPLLRALRARWHDLDSLADSYRDHVEIFDAIIGGQGTRAEHLAREHVYRAGRRLAANWRRLELKPVVRRVARRVSKAA